jgi:hypothetical protein
MPGSDESAFANAVAETLVIWDYPWFHTGREELWAKLPSPDELRALASFPYYQWRARAGRSHRRRRGLPNPLHSVGGGATVGGNSRR